MIQDQLTDYISSQMKLGVSRDAIKSALVSAGWVSADVEDTLKKVEGGANSAVAAQSAMAAKPTMSVSSASAFAKPADTKTGNPQMIRVSDLVSSSSPTASPSSPTSSSPLKSSAQFGGKISGNSFEASPSGGAMAMHSGGGSKMMLTWIVAGILVIVFAGAAWYFYSGNAGLAAQVSTLTAQSTSVNTELSTLKSQLDASSSAMAVQVASLTASNTNLALNLSFYAAPPGATGGSTQVTVSGTISGGVGKAPYVIMTSLGAKVFIANSTDAAISAQLKPLVGTTTVQIAGTYIPGSDEITVASVSTSTQQ